MKNGKIILPALGVLVLAVVAVGALLFFNSRPSPTAEATNTPRTRNTAVGSNANNAGGPTRDPQDDSSADPIPDAPIAPGSDPLDDSAPNTNNPNIPPAEAPPANDGMIALPGSAFIQMASDELYKFCSDNTWQISDAGDTVTGTGTFEQETTTLIMSGDGDPKTYELSWDAAASVLTLKQGETTLNLAYDGESGCP